MSREISGHFNFSFLATNLKYSVNLWNLLTRFITMSIVVAHDLFYVISVNVSISCQISKAFKHEESDKFHVSNSHQKETKWVVHLWLYYFAWLNIILTKESFHSEEAVMGRESPLLPDLMTGGAPTHQLGFALITLTYIPHALLGPGTLGHTHSGAPLWPPQSLLHSPAGCSWSLLLMVTASNMWLTRKSTRHHVNMFPVNPNQHTPKSAVLS